MEPDTRIQVPEKHFINRVTPFSKILALILFITLPILTLYLGYQAGIKQVETRIEDQTNTLEVRSDNIESFEDIFFSHAEVRNYYRQIYNTELTDRHSINYERTPIAGGNELISMGIEGTDGSGRRYLLYFPEQQNFRIVNTTDADNLGIADRVSPKGEYALFAIETEMNENRLVLVDLSLNQPIRYFDELDALVCEMSCLPLAYWITDDTFVFSEITFPPCGTDERVNVAPLQSYSVTDETFSAVDLGKLQTADFKNWYKYNIEFWEDLTASSACSSANSEELD